MGDATMEHRWGERISVYVPVRLDARPRALAPGCIRNASLSGAYIETSARLPPGTLLAVELERLRLESHERCGLRACLVRQDARGIAVEWSEFAPGLIRALLARAPSRSLEFAPPARPRLLRAGALEPPSAP